MRLDPQKTFDVAKDKVIETIKETFPIEEGDRTLEVEDVWVEDNKLVDDIRSQKMTKMRGGSWTVPIKGKLKLKDKSTGKIIDRKTIQLGRLPKTTRRFSHIVDGTEYNVTNQWLLRPGVYNRIRQDGSIASEFHTRGKSFRLEFDPKSKKFRMRIGGARPELYPFLKDMGVSDEILEKQWGKEILEANKKGARTKATDYIYRAYKGELPISKDEAIEYISNRFENTPLDPGVTKHTLGEAHSNISMKALLQGAQQTLDIARGKREPDVRDSLIFKRFNALEDHLANKLKASKRDIHNKTKWNLRRFDDIDRIVPRAAIDKPIKDLFTSSSLTSQPEQVNPVEFLADHLKTTVLGDGGLKTEQEATDALKDIDPTHFGFLDPLATPEGSRTGLTLQVAEGVEKDGDTLSTPAWNIKEKRLEHKTISDLYDKIIVLPDQVEIKDGDLKFKSSKVKAFSPKKGPLPDPISPSKADYAYIIPQQLYTTTTNLLPFMSSNTPYRITTAGRQITQAVPLKHREKPLVQAEGFEETVESLWGKPNAHLAPVSGEVTSVQADGIKIKDSDGKIHEVQLYHNFPLNADKSFITSEPRVQKGDKVKKDQVVADTTATKDGILALGTNLQVAYLPMQGLTYEDAIAVSESAAEKLTSEHLHKKTLTLAKDDILNKKKYQAYYGSLLDKTNVEKLDDDGVIRKGLVVKPGDLLIAGLKNRPPTTETRMLQRLNKSLVRPFSDGGVTWDKEYPGVVTDVVKKGGDVKVFVRTEQPLVVGDKLVGRAGNKAIVAKVLPDAEMPKTKDGTPVDILMNSLGVPGRINMSQILETAAGKVAEKTGKPYLAPAFSDEDIIEKIKKDLKAHGLRDKEPLYDAKTNKLLGDVLVGPQYMLKLKHTVENKSSARGGPGAPYDHNRIPKRGGPSGAQSIGNLGTYALLARGKDGLATLREAHTWKVDADQADEVWKAIQTGASLPAPRSTFASRKMMNYIKGMGVDIKKSGNALTLIPMTNKDILAMSAGEIKDPGKMVKAKDPTIPEVGGLFDLKATGGLDGNKWSHLKLPEPMPNPVFERGIRALLGITDATFSDVVSGKSGIDDAGNIVPMEKAKTLGGPAIKKLLDNLDVNQELKKAQESLKTARKDELSRAHKKVKYLQALKENNMTPSEAYMTNYIPVLPPQFRPLVVSQDGSIVRDDLNELYKSVGMVAEQLGKVKGRLPEKEINNLRFDLYDGMQALTGIGGHPQLQFRGLIDIIAGKKPDGAGKAGSPKEGFFQKKLIGARQNLSMRSTIVPDPTLSIDEVGLPRQAAMEIYKPFVVNELKKTTGISPLQAQKYIKDDDPMAWEALERVVHERPVWVKRDPVLHRYSVQAFNPKLVDGKVVHIHPLTTSGFNADFDGDSCLCNILLDITSEAWSYLSKGGGIIPHDTKIIGLQGMHISEFPRIQDSITIKSERVVEFDVPPGVRVPAYLGNKIKLMPVTKFSVHLECEEWKVRTKHKRELIVSGDHSLAVFDWDALKVVKKTPAQARGFCVPVLNKLEHAENTIIKPPPRSTRATHHLPKEIEMNRDMGWFLGALIGDGKKDDVSAKRWVSIVKKLIPNCKINIQENRHEFDGTPCVSYRVNVSSVELAKWLIPLIGQGSRSKHLPPNFLEEGTEFRQGLFEGLIDTDGTVHVDKNGRTNFSLTTVSEQLANEFNALGRSLGISSTITEYTNRGNPAYVITPHKYFIAQASWIQLTHESKKEALKKINHTTAPTDIIPMNKTMQQALCTALSEIGATLRKNTNKKARSLYTALKQQKGEYLRRTTAKDILNSIKSISPELYWWQQNIVENDCILWDYITEAIPTGETKTMYDITVPEAWTFVEESGAVLWDTVSAYVPISEEAVQEAYKATPSRNLFNPASGALMYTPSKEMQTGLYLMTRPGKKRSLKFSTLADAEEAVKEGKLDVTDVVNIGRRQTTVGQMRVASALPEPVAKKYLGSILDKKTQKKLFTDVALNHKHDYGNVADKLKDFGNEHIYATGFSLGLDDFKPHKKLRDSYIAAAEKMFDKLPKSQQTPGAKIELYDKATERMMKKLVTQQSAKDDKLLLLQQSGSKPGPLQYRQITLAPMLVKDPMGKIMESPVKTSFSEGLDLADYWKMSGGARQSVIQSVQSVRDPGYLTKQLMNTTMDHLVTEQDCGTTSGITLDCTEDAVCYDRLLAKPVTVGRSTIPANTVLTPEIMSRIQSNGGKKIVVRSPLKCKAKSGICSHCLGLDKEGRLADKGTAIGVTAGQALGERSTQLALRSFHGGGVLPEGGSKEKKQIADNFSRVQQLFTFPKILPKSAPVVEVDGIIKNIQKDPAGGHNVFIESNQAGGSATLKHYIPQDRGEPKLVHQGKSKKLQKGMKVDRGMALSDGPINPHDLLKATNIDTVQNYLTDELYNLYKNEGIDRRHIELNVRAATDSGLVVDPGDVPGYIRGDHIRLSAVRDENAKTQGKKMRVKPELRGINLLPLDISEDWLARLNHNKLSDTIIEAAQQGWTTRTSGVHPIPALVTGEQFGLGEFY